MNQIFNFSRFFNYSNYQVRMNRKTILLTLAGASVALSLFMLFFMRSTRRWELHHWSPMFMITAAIGGLLLIGNSFGFLRKKESTLNTLMLPVSIYEKYIYEYLSKVVLYTVLFPILFYLISIPLVAIAEYMRPERTYASFNFDAILSPPSSVLFMFALMYLFVSSLVFAGATVFKKYPLVKTLVFVGVLFLIGVSYFYIAYETFEIDSGMQYAIGKLFNTIDPSYVTANVILAISSATALAYGFFKLKEKEVS